MTKAWQSIRESAKTAIEFRYAESPGIPGTSYVQAVHERIPSPVGLLWFSFTGKKSAQILHVYVHEEMRRCGIATRMLYQLMAWYPNCRKITTMSCTKLSRPWLEKLGFKCNDDGDWMLNRDTRPIKLNQTTHQ